jgi:signal transduction histidine kinase
MTPRIRVSLAEDLRSDPVAGAASLHEIGTEADRTLEELRLLAHGVYPAILSDLGLEQALRSLVAQTPVPIHLQTGALAGCRWRSRRRSTPRAWKPSRT